MAATVRFVTKFWILTIQAISSLLAPRRPPPAKRSGATATTSATVATGSTGVVTPVVELQGVTKSFGDRAVLESLNVRFPAGVNALVGRSGEGKTTVLRLIAGIETPTAGTVRVFGKPVPYGSEGRLRRHRWEAVSFVFQDLSLIPHQTAEENVSLPLRIAGVDRTSAIRTARKFLKALGLAGRERARPHELSGGEQQRVAVARALASKGSLILADEPTAHLDADSSRAVLGALAEQAREGGRTVVVVTHSGDLLTIADHVWELADGTLAPRRSTRSNGILGFREGDDAYDRDD